MIRIAAACLALVAPAAFAAAPSVPLLGPAELSARLAASDPTLAVLDVRTPAEYALGHVPGAINVPHDRIAAELATLEALKDRDVVVYCLAGKRAAVALATLGAHGFRHLWHLDGDLQGWIASGRQVEPPAAPAPPPVHPRSKPPWT